MASQVSFNTEFNVDLSILYENDKDIYESVEDRQRNPLDTGRKLNVHKTFNLHLVSRGKVTDRRSSAAIGSRSFVVCLTIKGPTSRNNKSNLPGDIRKYLKKEKFILQVLRLMWGRRFRAIFFVKTLFSTAAML